MIGVTNGKVDLLTLQRPLPGCYSRWPGGLPGPSLGPDGWGALKLGMSTEQAAATGLITKWDGDLACATASLAAYPAGRAQVVWSARSGIVSIEAWLPTRTAEGAYIAMPAPEMRRMYQHWRLVGSSSTVGTTQVPYNDAAQYRITTRDGAVSAIRLELTDRDCY